MSESLKKRILSPEAKKRMSEGASKAGKLHKGMKRSVETRMKISQVQKGKKINDNQRRGLEIGQKKHIELIRSKEYWTEERRNIARKNGALVSYKLGHRIGRTQPEIELSSLLDMLNINHKSQYLYDYYVIDEFIPDRNLAIEVDGKYWHNYPYGRSCDRKKDGYLKCHGINVLRIWEDEIYKIKSYFGKEVD